jgi:hypothetical protein
MGSGQCSKCGKWPGYCTDCNPGKDYDFDVEYQAEAAECAHMHLDKLGIPREDMGKTLSLVGRIDRAFLLAFKSPGLVAALVNRTLP